MSIVRTNDANNVNTNRHVRFLVEAQTPPGANLFLALQGPQNMYPYYGKIQAPTLAQELAQLRLSLITRVLTQWAILVGVQVAEDSVATGVNTAVILTYEQDEMGVFYNNAWGTNPGGVPKHSESGTLPDITAGRIQDTVGVGGLVTGPKEKRGLQRILDEELFNVSYDGGQSGPFGALSYVAGGANTRGGDVALPDGRVVADADVLELDATVNASGLTVTYLAQ